MNRVIHGWSQNHCASWRLPATDRLLKNVISWAARCGVECRPMAFQVCAHITGTVWKIEVGVGDSVLADQPLVILESMKMEMPVEAPHAGRVSSISVAPGQAVEEGDVLLELA
jgi:acetyl-CoA carboxylase biotin carboxyl carrier protein